VCPSLAVFFLHLCIVQYFLWHIFFVVSFLRLAEKRTQTERHTKLVCDLISTANAISPSSSPSATVLLFLISGRSKTSTLAAAQTPALSPPPSRDATKKLHGSRVWMQQRLLMRRCFLFSCSSSHGIFSESEALCGLGGAVRVARQRQPCGSLLLEGSPWPQLPGRHR
jgi:hypothetical protein